MQITITDLKDILASRRRRLDILLEELGELVEKHGDDRRTHIDPMPLSMDREDLIEEKAIVITLSEDNYVRHTPVDDFRTQNRGGKGLKGVTTKNEDTPQLILSCFSKDRLLIFTDRSKYHRIIAICDNRISCHCIQHNWFGLVRSNDFSLWLWLHNISTNPVVNESYD